MTRETANHTTSGTKATAVMRCAHQCCTPCLAEPSPRARARGDRRSLMPRPLNQPQPDQPRQRRGDQGDDNDDPATAIDVLQLEAVARVPEQMPDAVAQMIEQAEQPAAEDDAAGDRTVEALEIGVSAGRR